MEIKELIQAIKAGKLDEAAVALKARLTAAKETLLGNAQSFIAKSMFEDAKSLDAPDAEINQGDGTTVNTDKTTGNATVNDPALVVKEAVAGLVIPTVAKVAGATSNAPHGGAAAVSGAGAATPTIPDVPKKEGATSATPHGGAAAVSGGSTTAPEPTIPDVTKKPGATDAKPHGGAAAVSGGKDGK